MQEGDNDNKAKHGSDFKKEILSGLLKLHASGLVDSVEVDQNIAASVTGKAQFYAPFLVKRAGVTFVIFSTTTARSDRIKINQWDANGIKKSLVGEVKCILVLPAELIDKEERNYQTEASRIQHEEYISALDSIMKVNQLEEYIVRNSL
jgi:hypothetical protein